MTNESPTSVYSDNVDLTNCDRELIHLIGKVQSHGILLAGEIISKKINRCSENCIKLFDTKAENILGSSLLDLLSPQVIQQLFEGLKTSEMSFLPSQINNVEVDLMLHVSGEEYILEIEEIENRINLLEQQVLLSKTISKINDIKDSNTLNEFMANSIKEHFGYDRVMIYEFDKKWNGKVVAEAKNEDLESWLDLHYPSTDIPAPARRLFYNENTRLIKDVFSSPVNIVSSIKKEEALDLSKSEYRATSPIHIEYLINMKVLATMTMPIVSGNIVWGLIACHHYSSSKSISYARRMSVKFLAKFFASQVQINKSNQVLNTIKASSLIRGELINQIIESWNIPQGLSNYKYTLKDLTDSHGAAICMGNSITRLGVCPTDEKILYLIERTKKITKDNFYQTNNLSSDFPDCRSINKIASGMMCVFISESRNDALFWFKPEINETVFWAGKLLEKTNDPGVKISPRKSFAKWEENQEGVSSPWQESEVAVVKEFRRNVMQFVSQKYDEIKLLNKKLKRAYEELESFSYSVSHDLRAPLRGIDGFAQIIKEDYYDSLDEFGKTSIETIINSVYKMNTLIDDILSYSSLDQKEIKYSKFSIYKIFQEEIKNFSKAYSSAVITLEEEMPEVFGDPSIIVLLVRNLLENALKYSSREENPEIVIGVRDKSTYYIQDNGVGFDQKHSNNIFKVFNRLDTNFDGSGIGLSIVKRIIDKHNGKIWVESEIGKGATFYFTLNKNDE